jgi:hypothetical protein
MVGLKRSGSVLFGSVTMLLAAAVSTQAAAQEDDSAVQACATAYEQAQVNRNAGRLQSAREELRSCVQDACPDFVRTDCTQWLTEVNAEIPSVIFAALGNDDKDLIDVKVTVDGEVVMESLDGRALDLDPGQHQLSFEHKGKKVEQTLLVRQGEKNRVVRVEIKFEVDSDGDGLLDGADGCPTEFGPLENNGCPVKKAAIVESPRPNMMRIGAYAGWGLGVAGFATFAIVGSMVEPASDDAKERCPKSDPDACTDQEREDLIAGVENKSLIANIGVGVGIAGAIGGTVLFILSMDDAAQAPRNDELSFDVHTTQHGGLVTVGGHF